MAVGGRDRSEGSGTGTPSLIDRGWILIGLLALVLLPLPALAQERTPADRQALADLAYVLGQSHALQQACVGKTGQTWRESMQKLLDVEAPDQAFNQRLRKSFNAGFAASQVAFPRCDDKSKAEAERIARRGKALSDQLAAP